MDNNINNKPVARLIPVSLPDREVLWARTFDEYSQESSESNPYRSGPEIPLYVAPPEVETLRQRIKKLEATPAEKREDLLCVISDLCDQVQERAATIEAQAKQLEAADYLISLLRKGFSFDSCEEELLDYEALRKVAY